MSARRKTKSTPAGAGANAGQDSAHVPAAIETTGPMAAVQADGPEEAVVRRTKDGWRVGGTEVPDLTSAMVLADIISAELASGPAAAGNGSAESAGGAAAEQGGRGQAEAAAAAIETSRLRATIGQLEHALTARIRVEQAIGVLAERHRIQPRQAFEQLREAARSRGRRVIDIASDVVASATNPLLQLPDELSRPRAGSRQGRRPHGVLGSE
jgi:hypothetical protein